MLRRKNRLSRSRDFDRVYRAGRSVASRFMVLYYFPHTEGSPEHLSGGEGGVRVGFSVSKRLGHAVQRNKIKRVLREAFQVNQHDVRPGVDLVFIARADVVTLVEEQGLAGVCKKMREALSKAGLLAIGEGRES